MAYAPPRRQRSTVLAVDTVGYTKLMELDENATHHALMTLRSDVFQPLIERFGGRIVKHTGDGFLASFCETGPGKDCAVEMQRATLQLAAGQAADRRLLFRMGLNVCDAIIEVEDIYGEGVNIAARLQAYAEPGDIVMTQAAADQLQIRDDDPPRFDLGELTLKNLSRPVRAVGMRIGSLGRPAQKAPSRHDQRPSIAVLPFRNLVPAPGDEVLAAGIVDEIVHMLGGLRQLFVIARTSTLSYVQDGVDIRDAGRQLGVKYVLRGTVQRNGAQLQISTELGEVASGQVINEGRVQGARSELFELQARIAMLVLRTLAPQVQERELHRIMRQPPESLTAYDLTVQALPQLYRMDAASHARARSLLQQAVSEDPDFAPARTFIAYLLIFRVGEGWSSDPHGDAVEAMRAANAALERNRHDALALAIFGHVHAFLFKNYDAGRMFLDRAIEVGPNCANAWTLSSANFGYVGEGEQAIAHAEHGLRLSPLDAHVFLHESVLAQAYYVAGRYQEAVFWSQRAFDQNGNAIANLRLLTASFAALGRTKEAAATAHLLLAAQPGFRMGAYAPLCPFRPPILDTWLDRLRSAGLPE